MSEMDPRGSDFLRLGWSFPTIPSTLPVWFLKHRVHATTRLNIVNERWGIRHPEFTHLAEAFRELGASVFTRHVKTCDENPWWPGAAGTPPECNPSEIVSCNRRESIDLPPGVDVVRQIIRDAHGVTAPPYRELLGDRVRPGSPTYPPEPMRIVTYFWHMSDDCTANRHPSWKCQEPDPRGGLRDATHARGVYLNLTTPYIRTVARRLRQLARRHSDGFNFDHHHLPGNGTFDKRFQREFESTTGRRAPERVDESNGDYRLYLEFQAHQVEKAFNYLKQEIKPDYPDVVFVVSTSFVPALDNPRMNTNLARIADSCKNEFYHALRPALTVHAFPPEDDLAEELVDVRLAMGWAVMRDSAEGRPPRIWGTRWPDRNHALASTAAVITHGGIANLDVPEPYLYRTSEAEEDLTSRSALVDCFRLDQRVSPYLYRTRPLRWAAVHFSEIGRNSWGTDYDSAWRRVLWPGVCGFGCFLRLGLPVGIVNDYQLEIGNLDEFELLFLPDSDKLSDAQRRSVDRFRTHGEVFESREEWDWVAGYSEAHRSLRDAIFRREGLERPAVRGLAPVNADGSEVKVHFMPYLQEGGRRIVVTITPDFSWVQHWSLRYPGQGSSFNGRRRKVGRIHGDSDLPPPVETAALQLYPSSRPREVYEVLTGQILIPRDLEGGYEVIVPAFGLPELEPMAVVVVDF